MEGRCLGPSIETSDTNRGSQRAQSSDTEFTETVSENVCLRVGRVIPNPPLRLRPLGKPSVTGALGITRPTF